MVDRGFLMNVLETFQLHPNFRKWISVLYEQSFSSVIVNGFWSEVFNVERVRQGCPLSPLLYVCLASPSLVFGKDSKLVPFVVPARGAKVKCAQYADDVTCIVWSLGSFAHSRRNLSIFERATGAKLNPEKTKGLRLGSWRYRDLPFGASWSDQNIKINAIWFGYDAPCDVTGTRRLRYLRADSKHLAPAGFRSWGKSLLLIVSFSPSCGTRALCTLFRVASWYGWRGRFFIHMVCGTELVKRAGIVQKLRRGD
ncbi:pol-like protein [Apostichopus japonicus]|uniref:Pol-like protein n=1 Tax=Stichopus japonicus TaxID=307972 RepID=A0A2G8JWR8_STIJA|nr:pol-like protein [Apostichopus japonicus]